jgi:hypothetical protein
MISESASQSFRYKYYGEGEKRKKIENQNYWKQRKGKKRQMFRRERE